MESYLQMHCEFMSNTNVFQIRFDVISNKKIINRTVIAFD